MRSGMYFRIGINIGFYMYITQKIPPIVRGPPILLSLFCRFAGVFYAAGFYKGTNVEEQILLKTFPGLIPEYMYMDLFFWLIYDV